MGPVGSASFSAMDAHFRFPENSALRHGIVAATKRIALVETVESSPPHRQVTSRFSRRTRQCHPHFWGGRRIVAIVPCVFGVAQFIVIRDVDRTGGDGVAAATVWDFFLPSSATARIYRIYDVAFSPDGKAVAVAHKFRNDSSLGADSTGRLRRCTNRRDRAGKAGHPSTKRPPGRFRRILLTPLLRFGLDARGVLASEATSPRRLRP